MSSNGVCEYLESHLFENLTTVGEVEDAGWGAIVF